MQTINETNRKTWWAINHLGRQAVCKCVYVRPADISSSGQNVQACFIYLLSHYIPCYSMSGSPGARGRRRGSGQQMGGMIIEGPSA